MSLDGGEKYSPERIAQNILIESTFRNAADDMGANFVFGGYYRDESNTRAQRSGERTISFNEKYLNMNKDELQRVGYHEIQHVMNNDEANEINSEQLWAFTFSNQFIDLHNRMLAFYKQQLQLGAKFEKAMYDDPPRNYDEMSERSDSYDHWDELLAHLKAYEIYLRQKGAGIRVETQPYEFIEAFKPEDLHFLDRNYRQKITDNIGEDLDLIKPKPQSVSISIDDL